MKYRVKFRFWGSAHGHYYTEWFDTRAEAVTFADASDETGALFLLAIEDEDGNTI